MSVVVLHRIFVLLTLAVLVAAAPTETQSRETVIIPLTRQRRSRANAAISPRRGLPVSIESGLPPLPIDEIPPPEIVTLLDLHGEISIGGQSFSVIFDTADGDIRLPGPDCTHCISHGKAIYQSKEDAFQPYRSEPDNDAQPSKGNVYLDTVTIGHLNVQSQVLAAVNDMDRDIMKSNADGYVEYLENPVFAFLLRPGNNCYSELRLGGLHPKIDRDAIEYIPVEYEEHRLLTVSFSVSGNVVGKPQEAIIDTRSNFIEGDPDAVAELYRQIPGSSPAGPSFPRGVYNVPCNTAELPPISLMFGDSQFKINPDNFVRSIPHHGCYGGFFAQHQKTLATWAIGSPFLYDVYTVFDVAKDQTQIGFATVPDDLRCAPLSSV